MTRIEHGALALAVALVAAFAAAPAAAASHPTLLFDAGDVPAIRATLEGPLAEVRSALVAGIRANASTTASSNPFGGTIGTADAMLAFAYGAAILDPASAEGQEASRLALAYLRGVCGGSYSRESEPDLVTAHLLFGIALSYDWLHGQLTESERQKCRDVVAAEGERMYQATKNAWWVPDYLQNHNWINHAALGMAALAFEGEIARDTAAWLEAARSNTEKVAWVLDLIHGGTWHEGTGYLHYGLDSLIPFSAALARNKGAIDYADNQIVRDYTALRMQSMPPARSHRREWLLWGDFSGLHMENTLLPVFYAAKKRGDGTAMWYAREFLDGQAQGKGGITTWPPSLRGLLIATTFYDSTIAPRPPAHTGAAWELDHYAHDLSLFTSRSGWEDGGALLALKSGVFGGHGNFERLREGGWPGGGLNFDHAHADDMGVQFFADGEWMTTRVPGYWIGDVNGDPEVNRTEYANSLLVDGKGQLGSGPRTCHMNSCPWFWTRVGSIPVRGSTAHFSYALAAGSSLYDPALGLTAFGRSVLFLDRRFPVIRDVIRGSQARTYEVVWHGADGATRDGSWLRLQAKNDRVLGVGVVAPASFEMRTVEQTARHLNKWDPDGAMTAAMVRPSAAAKDATFLAALIPARGATWADRPTVTALDPAAPDRGLAIDRLPDGERYEVLFNDEAEESGAAGGISLTGMAGVRKLRGGAVERALLAAGQRLELDGVVWIEVRDAGQATVEVEVREDGVAVSGEEVPLRIFAPGAHRVTWNAREVSFDRDGDWVLLPGSGGDAGGGGEGGAGGAPSDGSGGSGGTGGCDESTAGPVGGAPRPGEEGGAVPGGTGGIPGTDAPVDCGEGEPVDPGAPPAPGGEGGGGKRDPGRRKRGGCSSAKGSPVPLATALAALCLAAPVRRRRR